MAASKDDVKTYFFEMPMKIFTRTVFILTLFYLAKALAACCFCDPSFPLVFDELTVANADNSGKEPREVSVLEVNKNFYNYQSRVKLLSFCVSLNFRLFEN